MQKLITIELNVGRRSFGKIETVLKEHLTDYLEQGWTIKSSQVAGAGARGETFFVILVLLEK